MYAIITIAPFDPRNIPSVECLGFSHPFIAPQVARASSEKKREGCKEKKTQEVKSAAIKEKLKETFRRAPIYKNDFNTNNR